MASQHRWVWVAALGTLTGGVILGGAFPTPDLGDLSAVLQLDRLTQAWSNPTPTPQFLVLAGGGAPSYNEIALEKNVRYFQRTLEHLGINPAMADVFFANGNDGQATVRYINPLGREQFKVPELPYLQGAATRHNLQTWVREQAATDCSTFFYFTGHGALNQADSDNNGLILWGEDVLSVRELATLLDELPVDQPVVTMMAQCYAGAFANFIYQAGDPDQPLALQTRCGFFATVATRPSVGCTPSVNEADYEDYSSSFFAGLSGRDRIGNPAPSADYNQDGVVSYAEAHAFAKVDEETSDWPISTSEAWLQRRASSADFTTALGQPLQGLIDKARPEQQYVIRAIADRFGFDLSQSYTQNRRSMGKSGTSISEVEEAYLMRLQMELLSVVVTETVRQSGDRDAIASLDRILSCEASHL